MEKISAALLTFLFNATWQVALIACVASVAARLARTAPARFRHRLWVAALLLALAVPLVNSGLTLRPDAAGSISAAIAAHSSIPVAAPERLEAETSLTISPGAAHSPARPARFPARLAVPAGPATVLIALYGCFLVFRIMVLARAWWLTRSLLQRTTEIEFAVPVKRVIARCLDGTRVAKVRFLVSAEVPAPFTVGASPAIVVLPKKLLSECDEGMLISAVGHELVHVQCRDYLLNLFYSAVSIPLSFHPAAALIKRRIDETRELRCDEVVTDRLLSPTVYARSLVALAGAAHAFRRPATVAVGIADADILEERIMSMLNPRRISSARRTLLLVTAAVVFAVPCIAAAPYALHFNVEQPAARATTNGVAPAEANSAAPANQPVAAPAVSETAAAAASGQNDQKPATKMKIATENGAPVGFAYATAEQEQSGGESAARMKRKIGAEDFVREDNLTPEERAAREKLLVEMLAHRAKDLAALSKAAKITMQQAIEAALRQQQGTVMESSLMGERRFMTRQPDGSFTENTMGSPNPTYRVVILSGDENAPVRTVVLVSAVDGTILRTAVE